MKVQGRCHCGAIAFEADVDPDRVTICHCTDCQMLTGTAYRTTVQAPFESFVLVQGAPKTYVKTGDSGRRRVQGFCGDCGTPIFTRAFDNPVTYGLRIGTLAQRTQLLPRQRIWARSALPWSANIEAIPQRPTE
jgi:hypothetical protein